MQIFERSSGEAIRIGDEILVQVIETKDGSFRLGVVAPRDIAVVEMNVAAPAASLAERDLPATGVSGSKTMVGPNSE